MKNTLKYIFVTLTAAAALSTSVDAQIVASKTAVNNYDGTYTLTMEAYATGSESVTVSTKKIPIDAVLVLDCSGSMAYTMTSSSDSYVFSQRTLESLVSSSFGNNTTYYIFWSDGNYYPVTRSSSYGTRQAVFTVGTTSYGISYRNGTYSVPNGYTEVPESYKTAYLHTKSQNPTRLQALQEACLIFLNNLKQDQEQWNAAHSDKTIEHRVSIVTFASESSTKVTLANGGVVANYSSLISAIIGMRANGATRSDLGMSNANTQISSAREEASKLVLFFTDGSPTSTNGFETNVASAAIQNSAAIKTAGASVFALTVINFTADSNEDKFMNYVSSNYPDATSMTDTGTKASDGFYSIATDQTQLNKAFDTISSNVISGGTSASIDATTVVQDVISESFMLPAGAESSSVKVYTDNFKELQSGVYVFENNLTVADLVPTINGKKVTVTGFDYKANYCGYRVKRDSNGDIVYENDGQTPQMEAGGKKLVIIVTIVPDPDASSTGYISTNDDSQSGLYTTDGSNVVNFVTVPSKVYTNADMTLKITGLSEGESAIFMVTANVPLNMYGTAKAFSRTIALTGPSSSVVIKAPVTYLDDEGTTQFVKYTVTPTAWAWAYTVTPDTGSESTENISGASITKALMKVQDDETRVADNVFYYVAEKKTDLVVNGENFKENDFDWHNDSN